VPNDDKNYVYLAVTNYDTQVREIATLIVTVEAEYVQ